MPDISQLSTITTAATALSNLILVTPNQNKGYQPQNKPNKNGESSQPPPAILFHYEGEQSLILESDITDHYVEDNTAIQDQIALRPEHITTHGFVGELNDVVPDLLIPLKTAAEKLTIVSGYTPSLSTTALLAYNQAFQIYQVAANAYNSAVAAWSSITTALGSDDSPYQTKQQQYFQQFYGYWKSRTLFTVQTPWAIFKNMAIQSLRAIQEADTRVITDFEVTFKAIRFANTQTELVGILDSSNMQGRAAIQGALPVNLGNSKPQEATESFAAAIARIG